MEGQVKTLVAAAIPEQSVVMMPDGTKNVKFKILRVENSTPEAGKITWYHSINPPQTIVLPASLLVDVVSLP